jgi:hypothetical protein
MDVNELNGNHPKVVISVKGLPTLKMDLSKEAEASGMTLSEYCEMLLANRHNRVSENQQLLSENMQLKLRLDEVALLKKENLHLKEELAEERQNSILNDPRLKLLFDRLRGQKDMVENAGGENFNIVYNSPREILVALIYSSKFNL